MALSATVLGDLIDANLEALNPGAVDAEGRARRKDAMRAIAAAIVSHFQSSGQVAVTSVSGVTSGGGVSGPGTGTIL